MSDLFLIGHGSRDPAAAAEFAAVLDAVRARLGPARCGGGFLELAEPHVDAALERLIADGADDIVAVPYVLFGAGHLKDDGPAVLARARRRHPRVRLRLARDLGVHPALLDTAEDRARAALASLPHRAARGASRGDHPDADARPDHHENQPGAAGARLAEPGRGDTGADQVVLVGRGSTDPDACAEFVKFARLLGDGRGLGPVEPAFVAMSSPSIEEALDRCRRLGAERIAVAPLFLFPGRLVDGIARRVACWADRHPDVAVAVGPHLGPDPRLAALVVERFGEPDGGDVRMNCDVCAYRVRLPGYEEKVGTPLSLAPPAKAPRGWRARRAANQSAEDAATRRARPRRGLGRRSGIPAPPERGGPAVEIQDLVHRYPDGTDALAGVDLTVAPGERIALLGPNGSGKTTLALHLVGALEGQGGRVQVSGLAVERANLAEVRRRVGYVFQNPDDQLLLPTVAADVGYAPAHQGMTGEALAERVGAALEVVGLADLGERAPQHLSLGERRRVALAGVLAAHPEIIVLDEPTANLDPSSARLVVDAVDRLRLGRTVLLIAHDARLAALADRTITIDEGRLVLAATA
jgi:energy-coupling factor transporter ATP-binding protein EcfA2/sirohydrochlorin ferrochelatase